MAPHGRRSAAASGVFSLKKSVRLFHPLIGKLHETALFAIRGSVKMYASPPCAPPHYSVSPRLHPQPAQTALLSVRAWEASARQLQTPLSSAAAEISAQQIQYPLTTCRSLANVLPAAVGATLVGAVAYCELLPQCFCLPPSAASRHRSAVRVQLPWRLRSPRRTSLVPTRTLQRRRRRRSCADTPLVTTLSCPTVRRLPPRT